MLKLTHISNTKAIAFCAAFFLSSELSAQDLSSFEPVTESRPETSQDFSIAGISNRMTPDAAKAAMEEHFGEEVAFQEGLLKIRSHVGKGIQFWLRTKSVKPWIGPMQRMNSNPYDEFNGMLGTNALDEQVVDLYNWNTEVYYAPTTWRTSRALEQLPLAA